MTQPAMNESHQMRSDSRRASLDLTCGTRNGGGSGVWRRDTMDGKGDWDMVVAEAAQMVVGSRRANMRHWEPLGLS